MSSRRAPLTSNPNVVNSPLRGAAALAGYAKQKRSHATIQREEAYGQPPPVKKQALENGSQRSIRSPSKVPVSRTQVLVQRASATATRLTTAATKERVSRAVAAQSAGRAGQDVDNEKEVWKKHYRAKFPKMVFYFESIPDDIRAKLTKRVTYFGARQEAFFSIEVTHVITTRTIPPERPEQQKQARQQQTAEEQPKTINPSLLDRNTAARRKLLFEFRHAPMPSQQPDEAARRSSNSSKPRNNDVLHKAREMGKKIWSLDKFQTMLAVLLESEVHSGSGSYASRSISMRSQYGASKSSHEPNLLQLLHNERINGPSDRDPTAVSRELVYFKGPYIYVWDMDEKQKPIMARDYPKVANKTDGEWPQFRSVGNGRCPFVEEADPAPDKDYRKTREREKARATAVAAAAAAKRVDDAVPTSKPLENLSLAKSVTGKRTLAEMEDGDKNRVAGRAATPTATADLGPIKAAAASKGADAPSTQNAFISRAAGGGRLLAGEPVASGMQPSNITSAIRSQMISSTSGINGAKAGTSKEVHGLQRKVLQKATTPASHDHSSRRLAEISVDVASSRSTNMGRQTSRTVHAQDEDCHSQRTAAAAAEGKERKLRSQQTLKSKKDLKPGYCENCQDKFRDFDEHIASRKHRKFAENDDNWTELDSLLAQLRRTPKHFAGPDSDSEDTW
ncbi:Dfp1/Him1 domain-containing protein [Hirsutella rhossiliensis]|uniref:Dfp1/Him1 domain-containing protein n=1 Tax=Hirsutella rhossiliensis TaxID=111463 RepID=A0A9P8SDF0_9HYPO|nr:Dfp1/Him1 domain-containing protein [Hirsutella rhossiliensis]KAH0958668.1 Dfp1/Him1 domain-containing protein [Hirsutella rhossiliensis]